MLSLPAVPLPAQAPMRQLITLGLNTLFHDPIRDGELDFLEDVKLSAVITNPRFEFVVTLADDRLRVGPPAGHWDLRISGDIHDFLLLATRREDADTLFFQRRIRTEGDTELGLCLKNFLDAQDLTELLESLPVLKPLRMLLAARSGQRLDCLHGYEPNEDIPGH